MAYSYRNKNNVVKYLSTNLNYSKRTLKKNYGIRCLIMTKITKALSNLYFISLTFLERI